MQIGCSTLAFGALALDEALERLARAGFEAVEIGVVGSLCPHLDPMSPVMGTVAWTRALLEQHGLRVGALNSVPWLYAQEPSSAADLLIVVDRLLEIAEGLDCELIIDAGRTDLALATSVAAEAFRRGRDRHGVPVSVEAPHRGTMAPTVQAAVAFLALCEEPGMGVTYDTSHALAGGLPVADGLALLGDLIRRVQARDVRGDDIHLTPGDGDYEWDVLLRFLESRELPFFLEPEYGGTLSPDEVAAEAVRARTFVTMRAEAL